MSNTSQEAYRKIKPRINHFHTDIIQMLKDASDGLIPDEVIETTGWLDYTVRPRFTELKKEGTIHAVGTRKNRRGNKEQVYKLVEASNV